MSDMSYGDPPPYQPAVGTVIPPIGDYGRSPLRSASEDLHAASVEAQKALAAAAATSMLPDMPIEIQECVSEVQKHIEVVAKADKNDFAKYSYASADAIYGQITNKLGNVGLVIAPYLLAQVELKKVETTDKQGQLVIKQWCFCRFGFALAAKGKTYAPLQFEEPVFAEYLGPQTLQAAKSYAQKSFLRGLFKIPTGEVDLDQYIEGGGDSDEAQTAKPGKKGKAKIEQFSAEESLKKRAEIIAEIEKVKSFDAQSGEDFASKHGPTIARMTQADGDAVRAAYAIKAKRG